MLHQGRQRKGEGQRDPMVSSIYQSDSIVVTNVKVSKRSQPLGKIDRFGFRHVEVQAIM